MKRIDICNKVFGSNKTDMNQIQMTKDIRSPQFCSSTFCKYCFDEKKEIYFVCFFLISTVNESFISYVDCEICMKVKLLLTTIKKNNKTKQTNKKTFTAFNVEFKAQRLIRL